jgi:hypothetical protein
MNAQSFFFFASHALIIGRLHERAKLLLLCVSCLDHWPLALGARSWLWSRTQLRFIARFTNLPSGRIREVALLAARVAHLVAHKIADIYRHVYIYIY